MVGLQVTRSAHANFLGNGTQNFNPIAGSSTYTMVHDRDAQSLNTLSTSFFLSEAWNSLPDTFLNGSPVHSKDTTLSGDLGLRYGILNHVDFDLNVSSLFSQQTNRELSGAQFSSSGLNNLRVGAKYNFLDKAEWGLSSVISLDLNQARQNPFVGNKAGPIYNIEGIVDRKLRSTAIALNVGYRVRRGENIPNSVYSALSDQYIASLGVRQFLSQRWSVSTEIAASKFSHSVYSTNSNEIPAELLVTTRFNQNQWMWNMGGGARISNGLFTPDWRLFVGVSLDIGSKKPERHAQLNAEDVIQNFEVPFDHMMKSHEFRLVKTVDHEGFTSDKPPFELIRLYKFDFDFGSTKLRPEYIALIDQIGSYLDSPPPVLKVRVEGHTDSLGLRERNRIVGQGRADNLVGYLKERGFLKSIPVEAVGYGPDRPIADNATISGRQQNRRVEIRILRSPQSQKNLKDDL